MSYAAAAANAPPSQQQTPIQLAVGVMNSKRKRAFERRMILQMWVSMLPESKLAVRFVQRCKQSALPVVCVDDEDEHPKAVAWFRLALTLFPHAHWIGHSDDDVYLQARQVHTELSQLTPWREAYGLVNMMKPWRDDGPYRRQFAGILEEFVDPPRMVRKGIYPFLQGGFYALTRDLVSWPAADRATMARARG